MGRFAAALAALVLVHCSPARAIAQSLPPPQAQEQVADDLTGKLVTISFDADVTEESVDAAIKGLRIAQEGHAAAIVVLLTTDGGSVWAGDRLRRALEHSPVPTICVVDSHALSAGYTILQACSKRVMTPWALLMVHEPWRNVSTANWHTMERNMAEQKALSDALTAYWAHRLKISPHELARRIYDRDWYLTAEAALKVGAIDAIADSEQAVIDAVREKLK